MKAVGVLCLIVVTLAYTVADDNLPPVPADRSCEPGKSYKDDCNTCRCGNDGKIGGCTYKNCAALRSKRDAPPPICSLTSCRTKRSAEPQSLPPAPADGSCEPGKSYQVDCNTCICAPNGRLDACTLKGCLTKRSADPQECSDGETKQEACNSCRCIGGSWGCTRRACIRKRREPQSLPPAPADGSCEPGKSYQVDCNTCICAPNGRLGACTLEGCLTKRSADPQECSDGETKQEACNTCRCTGGSWACTRRACLRKRRDAQECSDGETKQEACNTCRCTGGSWACTRRACNRKRRDTPLPPLPADGSCAPGNSYQDSCNVCRCSDDGKISCTDKLCPSKFKRSADPQECSDGETKQEDCNTCRCTGGSWACTRRFCNRKRRDAEECKVGDQKQIECNGCGCIQSQDGKTVWACTKRACLVQIPRSRRDVSVTSDLKSTPCATNDVFQLDCNTCYCNSAKTGYLCTENICSTDNTTQSSSSSTERVESTSSTSTTVSLPFCVSTTMGTSTSSPVVAEVEASSTTPTSSTTPKSIQGVNNNSSTEEQNISGDDTVG